MGSQQNEEKKYVVNSQHDVRLPGLPSLKGNKNGMSVKSEKGAMNGTTHVGEDATGLQYRICKKMEVWVLQSQE